MSARMSTLFHALPGEQEPAVARALADVAESTRPFSLAVLNIRLLGRGVAYGLTAAEAAPLRRRLAACFEGWLTAQDRGGWWLHLTVQNKVAPELARDTQARLRGEPVPSPITATGLALWRYRGGPWEAITTLPVLAPHLNWPLFAVTGAVASGAWFRSGRRARLS